MTPRSRQIGPVVALLLLALVIIAGARHERPSERDDQVFLQAAYLMRTEHVSAIEAITRAAENQYGWGGSLSARLRSSGDIQTYALVPLWSKVADLHRVPSRSGRALAVESPTLQRLGVAFFLGAVVALYWAVRPLGRGVALAAAVVLGLGHPFRHGPALFDPWVMPLAALAIGCWFRSRHAWAATLAVAAIMVKPNYLFLLPAFLAAGLLHAGHGDPAPGGSNDRRDHLRLVAVYGGALAVVVIAYLLLAAAHVIALGQYTQGVRSGYDPAVLAYSLIETISYTYRAGTQQLREHWPIYPWTVVHAAALGILVWTAVRRRRLPRTTALLGGLVAFPVVANFAVLGSVAAYEDGGHFRWINVAIMGMAIALPLAYREAISWWSRVRARPEPALTAA